MSAPGRYFESADADRDKLRGAVAAVDEFIARLASVHSGPDRGLPQAWAELVKVLALEPARRVRDCPRCGQVALCEATRCLHCWERLTPVPEAAVEGRQVAGGADS